MKDGREADESWALRMEMIWVVREEGPIDIE
jgi:hypothetical protein